MKHISINNTDYLIRDLVGADIEFLAKYWAESSNEYWQSKGVDLEKVGTFDENKEWFTGYLTGKHPASTHIIVIAKHERPVIYSLFKPKNTQIFFNFNVMEPSLRDPKLMKPFFLELIDYLSNNKNIDCSRLLLEVATTDKDFNSFLQEELGLSFKLVTIEKPSGIAMNKNQDLCIYEDFSPLLKLHQTSSLGQKNVEVKNWGSYVEATKALVKPRGVVRKAVQLIKEQSSFPRGVKAIDIGCGTGRDFLYLLEEEGFSVTGIDSSEEAIAVLKTRLKGRPTEDRKIEIKQQDIIDAELNNADLVCSSYTLPFIPADKFEQTWKKIEAAILPGGYFAGHFFGTEDDWAKNSSNDKMSFFTENQIKTLFKSFDLIQKKERKFKELTADKQEDKNWHTWNIIARKR